MNIRVKTTLLAAALVAGATLGATSAYAQAPAAPPAANAAGLMDIRLEAAGDALGILRGGGRAWGQIIIQELSGVGTIVDVEKGSTAVQTASRCTMALVYYEGSARFDCEGPGMNRFIRVVKTAKAWDEGPQWGFNPQYVDAGAAPYRLAQMYLYPAGFIIGVLNAKTQRCPTGGAANTCGGVTPPTITDLPGGKTEIKVTLYGTAYVAILNTDYRPERIEAQVAIGGQTKTIVATYDLYRNGSGLGYESLDKFHTGCYFPTEVKYAMDGRNIVDLAIYEAWCDPFVLIPEPEVLWAAGYGSAR